ncbi:MAG: prepilin-type N-terminal cleavage/methylation domain-containing protein [Candidatus Pacebacteria bacterium]|jgi:hypothetical protein|nr:prepilin-type N-terminal cleavage/methylation domain-containing protein [Candidatus Paceibacterota bacterium]
MNGQIYKKNTGFTLVEILFAVSIFIVVSLVMGAFARNTWVYNSFISSSFNNLNAGRTTLKTMVAEIRTASSGDNGAYVVSAASNTSFTIYSDIDNDALKERVRYFVSGNSLRRGVIKPTGSPLGYTGTEVITTLIPNITNATVFEYYDKNYDGTTASLASPIQIPSVRLVKITVTIDENPNRAPGPITLTSQVTLRNIKDNL